MLLINVHDVMWIILLTMHAGIYKEFLSQFDCGTLEYLNPSSLVVKRACRLLN